MRPNGDAAEKVVADPAPVAPYRGAAENKAVFGMMDPAGPFDYRLYG